MAAIVDTVYSDRRIVLANEEIIRPIPFGNNWTQIRIGIRFAAYGSYLGSSPTVVTFGATSGLTIGVCYGPRGWMHDRPTDYVGHRNGASGTTWTNSAWNTVPNYYTQSSSTSSLMRKVASGVLTNTGVVHNTTLVSSVPNVVRNLYFVTITKGSSIGMTVHSCTTAGQVQADRTRGDFLSQIGLTSPSVLTTSSAQTFAYGAGPQTFDHIAIGWSKFYPHIEICDVAVVRFY